MVYKNLKNNQKKTNLADESATLALSSQKNDPIFIEEQAHLTSVFNTLSLMEKSLTERMDKIARDAEADKAMLRQELSLNFADEGQAQETYVDIAVANEVIDAYNRMQDAAGDTLSRVRVLLEQPYFAKISLAFTEKQTEKDLYIGTVGISDENYRRLVVDWRSPVAEVYYNQENGPTSYVANGKTIPVELKLRRQFDISADKLIAYFDTTVAIQDSLLLKSLASERSSSMKDITATIQKEQNQVIRHRDVPALLVRGIAGSGKTSVLLQRIAYLLYQHRTQLISDEVLILTPNPIFKRYIENVLPDLGENNPDTFTWKEWASRLLPKGRSATSETEFDLEVFRHIEKSCARFDLEDADFKEINVCGTRLISIGQIRTIRNKFKHISPGPHLITLMREALYERLKARMTQLAASNRIKDELCDLSMEEQLRLFHETFDANNEAEVEKFAHRYVEKRFGCARDALKRDEWIRIDRIGMRLIGKESLPPLMWLFFKMCITGLSDTKTKLVAVDEVQDYTPAQLCVLSRFYPKAHFILSGDEYQAIGDAHASFAEVREVFERLKGSIDECDLLTSYRSSSEITALFANLLPADVTTRLTSVRRSASPPCIEEFFDFQSYRNGLIRAIIQASENDCLSALIVPWKQRAQKIKTLIEASLSSIPIITDTSTLPSQGVIIIPLGLAKGLEFDHVIIPDASSNVFDDTPLARRRLYTTISRATRSITILSNGALTPLLQGRT